MKNTIIVALLIASLVSCKTDNTKPSTNVATAPAVTNQQQMKAGYPSLPQELLQDVWDNGEMIDYIFHNLPFSMNQTEQNSIRTNLTYIDPKPVSSMPASCKPFARQFYQVSGDIKLESDVYYDKDCQFYVFFVDGKAKYANYMADSGKKFFQQMVAQAMEARKNAGQQ